MIRPRSFEAEVKCRVREVVAASPEMLCEHKRRHAGNVWRRVRVCLWAPLLIATAFSMMPVSVFFPAFAPLLAEIAGTAPHDAPLAVGLMLGAQSLVIAAVACLVFGLHTGRLFCFPTDVAVLAHYPVSDRELLQRTWPRWRNHLAYYVYVLALVYVPLAWYERLNWHQSLLLGLLAALQAWHLLSLAVIVAHRIRWGLPSVFVGLALTGTLSMVSLALCLLITVPTQYHHGPQLAAMLLPTGWINGAIYYGVFRGSFVGWLFLIPVATTSAYALWWLRRGYAIREMRASPLGTLTPVFAYGLPNTPEKEDESPAAKPEAPALSTPTPPAHSIEKRLLNASSLRPPDWSGRGFVERWIAAQLSPRERIVLEQFYGGHPFWTEAWIVSAAFTICATLWVVAVIGPVTHDVPLSLTAVVLFSALIVEEFACDVRRGNGILSGAPALHPIFPVGLHETLSAIKKTLWRRANLCLPMIGALAFVQGWYRPHGWVDAACITLAALIQVGATLLIIARLRFTFLNRYRFHWRRWLSLGLLSLALCLNLPLMFFVPWIISLPTAALMLVFAWLGCRHFDLLYERTECDFEAPNPMRPRNQRYSSPINQISASG